jgi:hypothetical protein
MNRPAGSHSSGSPLDRVRVVLSHTSHPGNIGAAARAMKTMGLSRLSLVNPKHFPDDAGGGPCCRRRRYSRTGAGLQQPRRGAGRLTVQPVRAVGAAPQPRAAGAAGARGGGRHSRPGPARARWRCSSATRPLACRTPRCSAASGRCSSRRIPTTARSTWLRRCSCCATSCAWRPSTARPPVVSKALSLLPRRRQASGRRTLLSAPRAGNGQQRFSRPAATRGGCCPSCAACSGAPSLNATRSTSCAAARCGRTDRSPRSADGRQ